MNVIYILRCCRENGKNLLVFLCSEIRAISYVDYVVRYETGNTYKKRCE